MFPLPDDVPYRQPLRRKLPLLITTLLCIVVMAISWLGYAQLDRVLLDAARDRAVSSATQLTSSLAGSIWRVRRDAQAVAHAPAVVAFIDNPARLTHRRVDSVLAVGLSASSQLLGRSLWSRRGELLVSVGSAVLPNNGDQAPTAPVFLTTSVKEQVVGALRAQDGRVLYDILTPVVSTSGEVLGTMVETRRLGGGAGSQLFGGLVGPGVKFLIGNANGDLWTDMSGLVISGDRLGPPDRPFVRETDSSVAAGAPIPTTPWTVSLAISRSFAVAPARRFLLRAGLIAVLLVVLGAIAAWWLSRSITGPLSEVAHAAEEIAVGDYARRAAVRSRDEIGQLATSFNTMAERIAEASSELQARAAESEASATLLDVILASAPTGFALLDRELRYVRVNDALARLNELPAPEHIGRHAPELQPELDEEQVQRLRAMLEGGSAVADVELLRMEGDTRGRELHLRASFFPVSVGGERPLGIGMFVLDTTDRRGLEAQLQQAQRMEAVGQLAGGIAHDFNNLLTVITSYSAMLLADLPPDTPHGRDVREIIAASERAATLTRQLLAFSRQQVLQPRVLDLNALTMNLDRMLRRLLPEDIELSTELGSSISPVSADPGQVEQVVMNLVVNARDAMPDGGRIRVATSDLALNDENAASHSGIPLGSYTVLTVSDTGCGMDEATLARIFEPFFTTKPLGQGTGLGLSTVYGIVQQSGGHVTVASTVGRGTTFRIYLPAVVGQAAPEAAAESASCAAARSALVLLVEDEPNVRSIARRILERDGFRVLEAENGAAAVRVMGEQQESISLVLTDLVMPEMGGRELAAYVRRVSPKSRVLLMSGYTEDAILRKNAAEPGMLFLQKPFTLETLREKVREALNAA